MLFCVDVVVLFACAWCTSMLGVGSWDVFRPVAMRQRCVRSLLPVARSRARVKNNILRMCWTERLEVFSVLLLEGLLSPVLHKSVVSPTQPFPGQRTFWPAKPLLAECYCPDALRPNTKNMYSVFCAFRPPHPMLSFSTLPVTMTRNNTVARAVTRKLSCFSFARHAGVPII